MKTYLPATPSEMSVYFPDLKAIIHARNENLLFPFYLSEHLLSLLDYSGYASFFCESYSTVQVYVNICSCEALNQEMFPLESFTQHTI